MKIGAVLEQTLDIQNLIPETPTGIVLVEVNPTGQLPLIPTGLVAVWISAVPDTPTAINVIDL